MRYSIFHHPGATKPIITVPWLWLACGIWALMTLHPRTSCWINDARHGCIPILEDTVVRDNVFALMAWTGLILGLLIVGVDWALRRPSAPDFVFKAIGLAGLVGSAIALCLIGPVRTIEQRLRALACRRQPEPLNSQSKISGPFDRIPPS